MDWTNPATKDTSSLAALVPEAQPGGALAGADIICLAKDYGEDPTSNNHIMRCLSRHNRILWLNSISTRTPDLQQPSDLRKMGRKLKSFTRGATKVSPTFSVATPIVLPFPHHRLAVAVNQRLLPLEVRALSRRLDFKNTQLWTFLPTAADYVGRFGESLVVYYCTDEWSELPGMDPVEIARKERALCESADVVFTTSRTLYDKKRRYNPETYLAPHGVDHGHFAHALDEETVPARELERLPRPILGFFGLIERWVDLDLIERLARARPSWSFVLVGKAKVDTSRLSALANVHLLGRRSYAELPSFCRAFSLGLIPFVASELVRHVNPIKLREYLSAGLPVVSTPMAGTADAAGPDCVVADDPERFLAACELLLKDDSPSARRRRSASQAGETWERRVAALGEPIRRAQEIRRRRH